MAIDNFTKEIKDLLDPIAGEFKVSVDFRNKIEKRDFLVSKELFQVIVNLVQNSIDTLSIRKIENPNVVVDLQTENRTLIIDIEDNAGGVEGEKLR